jgi:D-glycero-D-manno-heptose 1,7-bisphosphate phosphatase
MREIGERYGVDLDDVPMVCDTLRDLQAAQAAGCPPHLVRTGRAAEIDEATLQEWLRLVPATRVHADLCTFVEHLVGADPGR